MRRYLGLSVAAAKLYQQEIVGRGRLESLRDDLIGACLAGALG